MAMAPTTTTDTPAGSELDEILDAADMNVLRMALYQNTGDEELIDMKVVLKPTRGGLVLVPSVAEEDHATIRRKAKEFIRRGGDKEPVLPASREVARDLMESFTARKLTDDEFTFGYEELAYDDFPRDVSWKNRPSEAVINQHHVTVIGAGIAGIAMGVQLKKLGIPFTILERHAQMGGTWFINRYPEVRVDTPSYLFQFKFEKNYPWTEYFASGQETLNYLDHVADKYDVRRHILCGCDVTRAEWDDVASKWRVTYATAEGSEKIIESNYLVSATGLFANPKDPDIAGIADFKGAKFHTMRWDQSVDYAGKRVAVIGNGSTGAQMMPGIAAEAAHVGVYVRTPQWITPAENYKSKMSPHLRWLFDNIPYYWNWYSYSVFDSTSNMQDLQRYDYDWIAKGGRVNERNDKLRAISAQYLRDQLSDRPDLFERLLPTNAPMGRRSIADNGWYQAIKQPHVDLVQESIERLTETGIRTKDGKERNYDIVVFAVGFATSKFLHPIKMTGREGMTPEKLWEKDGPRSHLGINLPYFPNFFIMYGPNGQPRAGGYYSWAELWTKYILEKIVHQIENGNSRLEVKPEAFDAYNKGVDEEMPNLLWLKENNGGYYVNSFGRPDLTVPWDTYTYHKMLRDSGLEDFNEA